MKNDDDFRTKRQKIAEGIRKNHREEIFAKRRNIETGKKEEDTSAKISIADKRFEKEIITFSSKNYSTNDFANLVQGVHSNDVIQQHYGLIGLRKLVSVEQNPPIQLIIDSGLVPKLIKYVQQEEYSQLQLEATWCLTNIAAGNQAQCNSIIEKGGIKIFVDLLLSETIGVVEQAIWALGNIACDSSHHRDSILKFGGLKNMLKVIKMTRQQLPRNQNMRALISSTAWSMSNLCRVRPQPEYYLISPALDTFAELMNNRIIPDPSIISNMCWSFYYYSNNDSEKDKTDKIQACINRGIIPLMIEYLGSNNDSVIIPCVRTLGNITTGNNEQIDYVLGLNILELLRPLLKKNRAIRKDVCWIFANIGAGTRFQIQALLMKEDLIKDLLIMLETDIPDVKSQIVFIFSNMTEYAEPQKLFEFFCQINMMKYYGENLKSNDSTILIENTLESLYFVLQLGEKFRQEGLNPFTLELEKLGLLPTLEKLQSHASINVSNKTLKIITKFFEIADPFDY